MLDRKTILAAAVVHDAMWDFKSRHGAEEAVLWFMRDNHYEQVAYRPEGHQELTDGVNNRLASLMGRKLRLEEKFMVGDSHGFSMLLPGHYAGFFEAGDKRWTCSSVLEEDQVQLVIHENSNDFHVGDLYNFTMNNTGIIQKRLNSSDGNILRSRVVSAIGGLMRYAFTGIQEAMLRQERAMCASPVLID